MCLATVAVAFTHVATCTILPALVQPQSAHAYLGTTTTHVARLHHTLSTNISVLPYTTTPHSFERSSPYQITFRLFLGLS
jgi:hypothetical protein